MRRENKIKSTINNLDTNIETNIEIAKLQVFDEMVGKVSEFVTVYKLFLRMRMRRDVVKEQIQWILSYVWEDSVNI